MITTNGYHTSLKSPTIAGSRNGKGCRLAASQTGRQTWKPIMARTERETDQIPPSRETVLVVPRQAHLEPPAKAAGLVTAAVPPVSVDQMIATAALAVCRASALAPLAALQLTGLAVSDTTT